MTKKDLIEWIGGLPEDQFAAVMVIFEGKEQDFVKVKGLFYQLKGLLFRFAKCDMDFNRLLTEAIRWVEADNQD